MEALLQFITLPLAILSLVALISFSYQRAKQLNVPAATRELLITMHALATEGCQLALIVIAIMDTHSCIKAYVDMAGQGVISRTRAAMMIEMFMLLSLTMHWVAICAVDFIEAWILLGHTGPMHRVQSFILTKSVILSVARKISNVRQRKSGGKHDVSRSLKDHTRVRLIKLDYLDLAIHEPVRRATEADHQPATSKTDTSSGSGRSAQQPGKHLTEGLLTPPDSNEPKDTKRVKWAPIMSVLSPSGVERRFSLP